MKSRHFFQDKKLHLLLIWLLTATAGTLLYFGGTFSSVERLALDRKFLVFQRAYEPDDIALITVDASSLDRFSGQFNLQWPWPREIYGMLVTYLDGAGARTITFDVLFDRPDIDRLDTEGPVSDRRFARAIHESGRVTLAGNSILWDDDPPAESSDESFTRHLLSATGAPPRVPSVAPDNLPLVSLRYATRRVGNAYMPTRYDGVIRQTYLAMPVPKADGEEASQSPDHTRGSSAESGTSHTPGALFFPSLPFAAYLVHLNKEDPELHFSNGSVRVGDQSVPLHRDGTYRINWYARGGVNDGTFPYYSFYDVFLSALAELQDRPERAPFESAFFEGKHILIGASAAGLGDIKTTPFSSIEPYPGMEVQATVLANLLDGQFLTEMSRAFALLLIWLLLLPVIWGVGTVRHVQSILLSVTAPLAMVAAGFTLFALFRFAVPTVMLTSCILIGIGITYMYRYLTEERQKKALRSAFSQYVQKEFVDRIAEDPDQLRLGGQKKELTVLFSDMANFTSISEKLPPEKLSELLNDYLTDMTRIVFRHGGTVDKFMGDAVMAFWGAPIDQPDHALRACRCAIDMQQRLKERADEWRTMGYPSVHIRIGVNTGPMVVGNMGSRDRFNYTVLGDAVNLGARLEPLNKTYGTQIMISEFTLASVRRQFASGGNPKTGDGTGGGTVRRNGDEVRPPQATSPQTGDRHPLQRIATSDKITLAVRELDRIAVKGKLEEVTVYELVSE